MRIVMLCGPPGAGKSTYVATHRKEGDCQVDMDLIPKTLPQYERREIRKALLQRAHEAKAPGTCWFSTGAPTRQQRAYWRSYVNIVQTIIFCPSIHDCLVRQMNRDGPNHPLTRMVHQWYKMYEAPDIKEPHTLLIMGE